MNERYTVTQHWSVKGNQATYINHRVWDGILPVFEEKISVESPTPKHAARLKDAFEDIRIKLLHEGFTLHHVDSVPSYYLFEREIKSLDEKMKELPDATS